MTSYQRLKQSLAEAESTLAEARPRLLRLALAHAENWPQRHNDCACQTCRDARAVLGLERKRVAKPIQGRLRGVA